MTAHTGRIGAAVVVIAETIVFVALVTLPGQGGSFANWPGSIERVRGRSPLTRGQHPPWSRDRPCHRLTPRDLTTARPQ